MAAPDCLWLCQGCAWRCVACLGGSWIWLGLCLAVLLYWLFLAVRALPGPCLGRAWAGLGLRLAVPGLRRAGFGLCPDAARDHHWSTLSTGGGVGDHQNVKVVLDDGPRNHQNVKVVLDKIDRSEERR